MATEELWLTITNVRLGKDLEVQVQADASDARDGTWLRCSQTKPAADKLYELVLKSLQENRKASGRLISPKDSQELVIDEVRVRYQ